VTGWVHTNSDLFTGHNTLTFADKVTYGHDWTIGFMPGDNTHPETPAAPNYPSNLPPALDVAKQPFGLDSTRIFNTSDANPNNDSYHELIEQAIAGSPDPLAGQRYFDQAGTRILIDGTQNPPTVKIYRYDGTEVKNSSGGNDKNMYTAITGALGATVGATTTLPIVTIQDAREAAPVRLTTLDVGAIEDAVSNGTITNSGSHVRWNGIIYIADTSGTSTTHRGIRLNDGKVLPTGGLTIASSNPVYIQGDYNTGTGTVPSDTTAYSDPANPPSPTASGYTKQPSSVIADAVNVLSNAWADGNSGAALSSRIASNTTVNTAIVAGIVQSGGGHYSGGAENFPRFLEDWSNKTFTYYGSMVELYQSKQAVGIWGGNSTTYSPPARQWFFDTGFYTYSPPGSLMIYSYVKGQWAIAQ
jgi:hypothetical protein